jgi:multidrug efflux system outer membrane protein
MMKPLLPFILPFGLLACTTVGPDYAGPPKPAADLLHFARQAEGTQETLQAAPWWEALGDTQLTRLIELALRDSPDLQAAQARLDEAAAGLDQQKAAGQPKASLSTLGGAAEMAPGTNSEATYHFYSIAGMASWELDLFGGERRKVEAAEATHDAVAADLADLQLSLAAQVADTYIHLRNIQTQERAMGQTREADQGALTLLRQLRSSGVANEQDVEQRISQLAGTQAQSEQLVSERLITLDKLAMLCGQTSASLDYDLADTAELPALPTTVEIGDPARLLQHRPDIRAAERRLVASNAQIGVQQANYFPKISLIGGLSLSATELGSLFKPESGALFALPYLSWDFLDFNRTTAAVAKAHSARDEATANYRASVLRALNDANSALSRYGQQRQILAQRVAQRESARRQLDIITLRQRAGVATMIELADARRAFIATQRQEFDARADMLSDYILLQKSLGMGWRST